MVIKGEEDREGRTSMAQKTLSPTDHHDEGSDATKGGASVGLQQRALAQCALVAKRAADKCCSARNVHAAPVAQHPRDAAGAVGKAQVSLAAQRHAPEAAISLLRSPDQVDNAAAVEPCERIAENGKGGHCSVRHGEVPGIARQGS